MTPWGSQRRRIARYACAGMLMLCGLGAAPAAWPACQDLNALDLSSCPPEATTTFSGKHCANVPVGAKREERYEGRWLLEQGGVFEGKTVVTTLAAGNGHRVAKDGTLNAGSWLGALVRCEERIKNAQGGFDTTSTEQRQGSHRLDTIGTLIGTVTTTTAVDGSEVVETSGDLVKADFHGTLWRREGKIKDPFLGKLVLNEFSEELKGIERIPNGGMFGPYGSDAQLNGTITQLIRPDGSRVETKNGAVTSPGFTGTFSRTDARNPDNSGTQDETWDGVWVLAPDTTLQGSWETHVQLDSDGLFYAVGWNDNRHLVTSAAAASASRAAKNRR